MYLYSHFFFNDFYDNPYAHNFSTDLYFVRHKAWLMDQLLQLCTDPHIILLNDKLTS